MDSVAIFIWGDLAYGSMEQKKLGWQTQLESVTVVATPGHWRMKRHANLP
jgi:hypothetical protein